jgi:hypothetical protein
MPPPPPSATLSLFSFSLPSLIFRGCHSQLTWAVEATSPALRRSKGMPLLSVHRKYCTSVFLRTPAGQQEASHTFIPSSTGKQALASSGRSSLPWLLSRAQGTESPLCLCMCKLARVKPMN